MTQEQRLPMLNNQTQAQFEKKVLNIVFKELQEIKQKIANIENGRILEEIRLSEENIKNIGAIKSGSNRVKKKSNYRLLLKSEIFEAQSKSTSATDAARYLGVGYNCYKKWATTYGIFKTNPWVKGTKKNHWSLDKGKYPLNQVLEGKFPDYPIYRLKDVIILTGIKMAKCENCGFKENRVSDNKIPLLIRFKDGNEKNHLLENIEILCYNCMFLMG